MGDPPEPTGEEAAQVAQLAGRIQAARLAQEAQRERECHDAVLHLQTEFGVRRRAIRLAVR